MGSVRERPADWLPSCPGRNTDWLPTHNKASTGQLNIGLAECEGSHPLGILSPPFQGRGKIKPWDWCPRYIKQSELSAERGRTTTITDVLVGCRRRRVLGDRPQLDAAFLL